MFKTICCTKSNNPQNEKKAMYYEIYFKQPSCGHVIL